mgnify:FL=1
MSDIKAALNGNTVITGEVRLSFVHLLEPADPFNTGKPQYSARILIPKDATDTFEALKTAKENVIRAGKDKYWGGAIPKKITDSMVDSDVDTDMQDEIYADKSPEEKGHFAIAAKNANAIEVVNAGMRPASEDEVYSGVYARVALRPWIWGNNGKKGISYTLEAVQIIRDGERLGGAGKTKASSVFSAVAGAGFGAIASDSKDDDDLSSLLG